MQTKFAGDQARYAGGSFSFAQISDPHLTSLAAVHGRDLLNKRLLGYLSWLRRRRAEHQRPILEQLIQDLQRAGQPDQLLITGDLTHIGLPEEFQQARRWLESIGNPAWITLVPGNHDTYVATGWGQTLALWQPYMVSDPTGNDDLPLFPALRIRGPVAFIGLSSAVPTRPFLATGTVSEYQLEHLEQLLEQTRRKGLFRVLMMHHSPASGVDRRRKHLTNQAGLRKVLEHQGAELVLHGHTHRSVWEHVSTTRGDIPVIGTPSASAVGHRPGHRAAYHLYRLERGESHWQLGVEIHRYSPQQGGFRQIGERHLELPACQHNPCEAD